MKPFVVLIAFAVVVLRSSPALSETQESWPALPKSGIVTGRTATKDDVAIGEAIFSTDGTSRVSSVEVPQYVWWRDGSGKRHPRVLVQAEVVPGGTTIVGLRDAAGGESAATLQEVDLLGTRKPE